MIVCQYSYGESDKLLELTENYHRTFCKKHKYEYFIQREPLDKAKHHYWQKPLLIKKLFEEGHTDIVYLDTDAFWLGAKLNPVHCGIGAVQHFNANLHTHHNIGVLYLRGDISRFLSLWLNEPDDGHPWGDNWSFIKLFHRNAIQVTTLGSEWNSFAYMPYAYKGTPKVAAWHGACSRRSHMKAYIEAFTPPPLNF